MHWELYIDCVVVVVVYSFAAVYLSLTSVSVAVQNRVALSLLPQALTHSACLYVFMFIGATQKHKEGVCHENA